MKVNCPKCLKVFDDAELLEFHMDAQHVHGKPTDKTLDDLARAVLFEFLKSDGMDRGLLAKAKQANTYRSTEAKREQTQGAREATLVMMARELAENKSQFRELLKIAMPYSRMLKAAPEDKAN